MYSEKPGPSLLYTPDPLLDHGRAAGSGKNRQIAPLGMAAEPHGGCVGSPDIMGVVEGQKLGRNDLPEAHVKVFFPAHQRIVRTPERKHHAAVGQKKCDCRELGIFLRDKLFPIHKKLALAEAVGIRRRPQEQQVIFCPCPVFVIRQGKEFFRCLSKRDTMGSGSRMGTEAKIDKA